MTKTDTKIEELFNASVHLGHKTNRIHPKARKYIYTIENATSIIDLSQTVTLLENAKKYVKELVKEGKELLFVVTKKIASTPIEELFKKAEVSYVTTKWPAGLLTNFETLQKNVKKLKDMTEAKEKGDWQKMIKHEQVKLSKELSKLNKFYGGLMRLNRLPDALFVIDAKKEKNAVKEAHSMHIPLIAVVDTNVNPEMIDYPIPGNDDSLVSVEYLVKEILTSYKSK